MTDVFIYLIVAAAAMAAGYGLFILILRALPGRLRKENQAQKEEVIKEALNQRESIRAGAVKATAETMQLMSEELDEDILETTESLKAEEIDLNDREEFLQSEQARIEKLEAELARKQSSLEEMSARAKSGEESSLQSRTELIQTLERKAGEGSVELSKRITDQLVQTRQLECQKFFKTLTEDLDSSARKLAQRVLDRAHARYAPDFAWPKSLNTIEVTGREQLEFLMENESSVLDGLRELSGVEINVMVPEDERNSPLVRVAGGYGPYREAAKLTIADLLQKGRNSWNQFPTVYEEHKEALNQQCRVLGKKAVNILKLDGIHPEIQMLIGSLNWRTSYRQNQWYHTVEVATLAGILAHELDIDSDQAKRVGLLHDIGKAIDYRIEGSHAVISGDYADRYGEAKIICDTVMSHHADLLVETPLAYILRVADTLSGARPGARVNLEEGYQIRIGAIAESVRSFQGVSDLAIMNGGREVHVQVNHKRVRDSDLKDLAASIARKIEEDVAFPGQIKVLVTRQFESVTVA
jgi:ribonuclease Y